MLNKGMYKGIYFDDIHSFYDLNLILAPFVPVPATAKTNYIEITGGDGSLDLSEALGEIKYKSRDFTFTFTINPLDAMTFDEKVSQVSNALNGKRCKITLDRDPDYYWEGRCTVDKYAQDKNLKQISVKATVKPYKLKQKKTRVIVPLCSKNLLNMSKYTQVVGGTDEIKYENDIIYIKHTSWNGLTLRFEPIPVNPKNTYTFSYDVVGGDRIVILFFDEKGNNISEQASSTGTYLEAYAGRYAMVYNGLKINMSSDVASIQIGLCGMNNVADGGYNQYSSIQLEVSDVATDYEAYTTVTPQEVTLSNSRKTVSPIITCSENATITFNENEYTLNAGTHKILDIQLHEGEYPITVDGSGFVIFEYQEGKL